MTKTFLAGADCTAPATVPTSSRSIVISFKSIRRLLTPFGDKKQTILLYSAAPPLGRFCGLPARARVGERRPHHVTHLAFHQPCRFLAVGALGKGNRLAEMHLDVEPAFSHQHLEVRHQILIADPGGNRPVPAAERHAVQARIDDRHRLDEDLFRRSFGDCHRSGAEQRALERQDHVAVAGRAFGKQHHGVALGHAVGDLARLIARRALALALDEDGALQLRQHADQRPPFHVSPGDELHVDHGAEHHDVGPGDVVGRNQQRTLVGQRTPDVDAHAQRPDDQPMPDLEDERFRPPTGLHRQYLQWHENQRAGDDEAQRQENPDFSDHAVLALPRLLERFIVSRKRRTALSLCFYAIP
ncbi:hypothetical protein MESS4_80061 [Mesorhizobium sp. STM 4661]|nr:hypothetical protein MESS4_80061 [Mesorhizobium sp. STM 4661]